MFSRSHWEGRFNRGRMPETQALALPDEVHHPVLAGALSVRSSLGGEASAKRPSSSPAAWHTLFTRLARNLESPHTYCMCCTQNNLVKWKHFIHLTHLCTSNEFALNISSERVSVQSLRQLQYALRQYLMKAGSGSGRRWRRWRFFNFLGEFEAQHCGFTPEMTYCTFHTTLTIA